MSYDSKQAEQIAHLMNAHDAGDIAVISEHIRQNAETLPYMKCAHPMPEDVITFLSESDPDVEILSEKDFI